MPVPVAVGALHLFVSGFSCKANSTQNKERFTKDPCESHHFESFVGCLDFCKKYRPQFVLLEDVCGIQLQKARGQKETVLDEIMKRLHEVEGGMNGNISLATVFACRMHGHESTLSELAWGTQSCHR